MTNVTRRTLSPGEHGDISVMPLRKTADGKWETVPNGRHKPDAWRARARYVSHDNVPGDVSRRAATKRQAIAQVEQALRERLSAGDSNVEASTPLRDACERWLSDLERSDSGRSARTVTEYRGAYERCIKGERKDHKGNVTREVATSVKALTLGQANDVQRLTRFLRTVADERGTASTKHVRAILTGVLQHAVTAGILPTNAMRSVGRVESQRKPKDKDEDARDTKRAFTDDERAQVLAVADQWARPVKGVHPGTVAWRRAVADLVRMLAGTGMRIGEALALRWEHVDLTTGRIAVPGTKSANAARNVNMPDWLHAAMRDRAARQGTQGLVFHAPRLKDAESSWNAANCSHAVTKLLVEAGCPWARSHTFRKTVATRLASAGVPLQQVSNQLGHADPSFTASVYLGRDFQGDKSDLAQHL